MKLEPSTFNCALPVEFARVLACRVCDRCTAPKLIRDELENVPQPGYVGREYENTRVLLVGQNPATPKSMSQLDVAYTAALRALRDDPAGTTYVALSEHLRSYVQQWPVHNAYFPLAECGLTLDQIAYFNVVRCRTKGDAAPGAKMTAACIREYFDRWILMLQPRVVIFIGKWAAKMAGTVLDAHGIPHSFINRLRNFDCAAREANRAEVAALVRSHIQRIRHSDDNFIFNNVRLVSTPNERGVLRPSIHYLLGKEPSRKLKDHNEVSWRIIRGAFQAEKAGTVSGDTLCSLVRNHVHGDKSRHGPQAFLDYCVKVGWLKVA